VQVRSVLLSAACSAAIHSPSFSAAQAVQPLAAVAPAPGAVITASPLPRRLPMGTVVIVMTNEELSSKLKHAGDHFGVTVLQDVSDGPNVVIPKGTTGFGEITFASRNGGFGRPGILSISLRYLELNGMKVLLDGHYREEGANKNGATFATWFAVGVFSGFIRGKAGVIPKGRELKAHTGEEIAFPVIPAPAVITTAVAAATPGEAEPAKTDHLFINNDTKTGEPK
jgi:hypothetical protein